MKKSAYQTIMFLMVQLQPLYAYSTASAPPGVSRVDLQHHNISIPGWEAVQNRVDFAPGASFPRHVHPGEEVIYVLEGLLEYQVDGEPPKMLRAGDVLFIPAGIVHSVRNLGDCKGSELGTYIVELGQPLVTIVE